MSFIHNKFTPTNPKRKTLEWKQEGTRWPKFNYVISWLQQIQWYFSIHLLTLLPVLLYFSFLLGWVLDLVVIPTPWHRLLMPVDTANLCLLKIVFVTVYQKHPEGILKDLWLDSLFPFLHKDKSLSYHMYIWLLRT